MENTEEETNKALAKAAKRFQRRRNRPSTAIISKLKQKREAAGLPLNAVNPTEPAPPTDKTPEPEIPDEEPELPVEEEPNFVIVEPEWGEVSGNDESWHDKMSLVDCNMRMFSQEIGCDVTLLVGESKTKVKAHSYVLVSRSSNFASILKGKEPHDSKKVNIPNLTPETVKLLLSYIYTDKLDLTKETAAALIEASSAYGPATLKAECFLFLLAEMSTANVCVTMELAHKYDDSDAYKRCLNFIYLHAVEVLRTVHFKQLCRECVQDIVKSDDLNAGEFIVFEGLVFWANGECTRERKQPDDLSRREALGDMIFHVRFATMDVQDFTQQISHREILTQEEKIILYQYFHGETYKLPPHFITRRRHEFNNTVTAAAPKVNPYIPTPSSDFTKPSVKLPQIAPVVPYNQREIPFTNSPFQRVVRFQGLNRDWHTRGPDAIGFSVSNPIILRGVQIFGAHSVTETYDIEITVYNDKKEIVRQDKKTVSTGETRQLYDILLTNPLRVPENTNFVIQILMKGKPTYHGIRGLDIMETGGIMFQFFNSNKSLNGTDVTIGQIPSIMFSKL